jgi:hypothetical protein
MRRAAAAQFNAWSCLGVSFDFADVRMALPSKPPEDESETGKDSRWGGRAHEESFSASAPRPARMGRAILAVAWARP